MKRIIRLTERDLTRIVKRVLSENEMDSMYFTNMDVDLKETLFKSMSIVEPCRSIKLKTYFNRLFDDLIMRLFNNETFRNEMSDETTNVDEIERGIRKYVIENYLETVMRFYELKCKRKPKY